MIAPFSILISSQKLSRFVAILLGGLLAYQLALLTWSLLPTKQVKEQWIPLKIKTELSANKIDVKSLQRQHLFGKKLETVKLAKQVTLVNEAPKTKLNLTLVGVVAATDPFYSSAIITSSGKQDSYFVDSKITGSNATLSEIHQDRVILSVNGELQTLMLSGVENIIAEMKRAAANRATNNLPNDKAIKTLPLDRAALLNNPGTLTDYIGISPVREDGELLGYRVRPGKDASLFNQAGLQNGDLAIELNGVDLTDAQQTFSLMKAFPTMTDISLTIERDGQLHELSFSIP